MLFNYSKNFNILSLITSQLVSVSRALRAYFFFSLPLERGGKGNSSFYSDKLFLKKIFIFFSSLTLFKTPQTFSKTIPANGAAKVTLFSF